MLSYRAIKDIDPEDKDNEMIAYKGDILHYIEDEEYAPGDEFVLCVNERTKQEAYIEVAEYEIFDAIAALYPYKQEQDQEPRPQPQPLQKTVPEQTYGDPKPQLSEEDRHYEEEYLRQSKAIYDAENPRNQELLDLMKILLTTQNECSKFKAQTSALRVEVEDFKREVDRVADRFK